MTGKKTLVSVCALLILNPSIAHAMIAATSSSIERQEVSAANAVDGNLNTRWSSSFADNQWLQLDLGAAREFSNLDIYWEAAYTRDYEIQVSADGAAWNTVFTEPNGNGGMDEITIPSQTARYVKINCRKRGTEWGNSIYEVTIPGVHEISHELPDPGQRRHDYLITEEPLVLEWLKQVQDMATPDHQLVSAMECNQLQTFNNSLVAMAFIVKGERERAERILDFFQDATDTGNMVPDRQNFFYKGEARGFYQMAVYETRHGKPGYYALGCSDRWMGDLSWLLTACKYYEKEYGSDRYQKLCGLIKNLMITWFKDEGDAGYVQHGWRLGDQKLHEGFGHHEGNIDAYAVFKLCGEEQYAGKVRNWLDRNIQGSDLPLDLYTWRVLAFGPKYAWLLNIPDSDPRFRKTLQINGRPITGFYHGPSGVNNIWMDGTGHIAAAYRTCGDEQRGNFYANQLDALLLERDLQGKRTRALPYTANNQEYEWVDTTKGFVSVAAWYIFAKNGFNPLRLERVPAPTKQIPNPYIPYRGMVAASDFSAMSQWQVMIDEGTRISFANSGDEIVIDYSFAKGNWGLARKESDPLKQMVKKTISFELKTEGSANNLEIKWVEADDSVFGWRVDQVNNPEFVSYTIKPEDITYWWGGSNKTLDQIKYVDLAVSKAGGGSGKIFIRNLEVK